MKLKRSHSSTVSVDNAVCSHSNYHLRRSHSVISDSLSKDNYVRNNLTDGIAKMEQVLEIFKTDLFSPGSNLGLSRESCLRVAPKLQVLFNVSPMITKMEVTEVTLKKMANDVLFSFVKNPAFVSTIIQRARRDVTGILNTVRLDDNSSATSTHTLVQSNAKGSNIDGEKAIMAKAELIKLFLMTVYNGLCHVTTGAKQFY